MAVVDATQSRIQPRMLQSCIHTLSRALRSPLLQTETRSTGVEREAGVRQEEHLGTQVSRAELSGCWCMIASVSVHTLY